MSVIALGFYLATLAPGLTWAHDSADGGELAAAAWTLGIPHPPGYPTYILLTHLFTLLPVGEVAARTNLFSALCAAATAALAGWTLARRGRRLTAAVGAGLALAFAPLLWSQATVTEVHALNGLFTALLLAPAATVEAQRSPPIHPLVIGIVWGLSLGNHPTALFCAPLVALAIGRVRYRWALVVAGIALGLTVYLYLPLRAAANPPLNWGDPQTAERFWWVISGAPYRQFVLSLPREYLLTRSLAWAGLLTQQFGWVGLVAAALGAAALWTTERPLLAATGVTVALCSVFAVGYDTSDSHLYLIPALVCLGLWLGTGTDWLLRALAARTRRAAQTIAALVVVLPLIAAVCRFPALDLSRDRAANDFGAAILGQAPTRAVVLSQRDAHTFALWYFQYALGSRPDIVVVDLDLLGYDWYTAHLSERLAAPWPIYVPAGGDRDLQQAAETLGRPVCRIDAEGTGLACAGPW